MKKYKFCVFGLYTMFLIGLSGCDIPTHSNKINSILQDSRLTEEDKKELLILDKKLRIAYLNGQRAGVCYKCKNKHKCSWRSNSADGNVNRKEYR